MTPAEPAARPRLLCVDDEPAVLDALRRTLRARFDVVVATGGAAGLEVLAGEGRIAVVLSDMRMPGMSGATFLARARVAAPEAVRVLLTGQADVASAVAAINEGSVYRFLCKPCPPDVLLAGLEAALEQHRLIVAEHELLGQTLRGSIRALWETLALASPVAFGRASRIRRTAASLAARLHAPAAWQIDLAATLGQLGAVTLPRDVSEKLDRGKVLTPAELLLVDRLPAIADRLVASIPRLEAVRAIIRYERKSFDGSGVPVDAVHGEAIPLGARVLRVAADFDTLEAQGLPGASAVRALEAERGAHDPVVLAALADQVHADARYGECELRIADLRPGMVLASDVHTLTNMLLVSRGNEVTENLIERIRNFASRAGVREPIRVLRAAE